METRSAERVLERDQKEIATAARGSAVESFIGLGAVLFFETISYSAGFANLTMRRR